KEVEDGEWSSGELHDADDGDGSGRTEGYVGGRRVVVVSRPSCLVSFPIQKVQQCESDEREKERLASMTFHKLVDFCSNVVLQVRSDSLGRHGGVWKCRKQAWTMSTIIISICEAS